MKKADWMAHRHTHTHCYIKKCRTLILSYEWDTLWITEKKNEHFAIDSSQYSHNNNITEIHECTPVWFVIGSITVVSTMEIVWGKIIILFEVCFCVRLPLLTIAILHESELFNSNWKPNIKLKIPPEKAEFGTSKKSIKTTKWGSIKSQNNTNKSQNNSSTLRLENSFFYSSYCSGHRKSHKNTRDLFIYSFFSLSVFLDKIGFCIGVQ